MAFRRDSKVDAFQRQISALRHQLGGETEHFGGDSIEKYPEIRSPQSFLDDHAGLNSFPQERHTSMRHLASPEIESPMIAVPQIPAIPSIDTETSVIAHTTVWSGNLESTGSLHVHGRVEGSLTARDDIFIAEEADVDAVIMAANVTIAGTVRGSIQCLNRFEILPHGRVSADVRAPAIVIHDGAVLTGEIAMAASGDLRGKVTAVPPARAATGG